VAAVLALRAEATSPPQHRPHASHPTSRGENGLTM
jgi:hypothetical protein